MRYESHEESISFIPESYKDAVSIGIMKERLYMKGITYLFETDENRNAKLTLSTDELISALENL